VEVTLNTSRLKNPKFKGMEMAYFGNLKPVSEELTVTEFLREKC